MVHGSSFFSFVLSFFRDFQDLPRFSRADFKEGKEDSRDFFYYRTAQNSSRTRKRERKKIIFYRGSFRDSLRIVRRSRWIHECGIESTWLNSNQSIWTLNEKINQLNENNRVQTGGKGQTIHCKKKKTKMANAKLLRIEIGYRPQFLPPWWPDCK